MMDVLDWYKLLPVSKEKFFEGIKLLSVSDYASEMGDNRISSSIDETVFDIAINLAKEIKGYKNPMLDAVFKDSQVKFTNITTEENVESKVQKFKAKIDTETYALNDLLYVSVTMKK